MSKDAIFHLPTKPMSLIDRINRHAAATGSVGYARASADADYNGHVLRAYYNDYRKYYVCEYQWGERVVISRGTCEQVLRAAIAEFGRQGRGASLAVYVRTEDVEIARALGLIEGLAPDADGSDWRFAEVPQAMRLERQSGIPAIAYLLRTTDKAEYTRLCFPNIPKTCLGVAP